MIPWRDPAYCNYGDSMKVSPLQNHDDDDDDDFPTVKPGLGSPQNDLS